MKTVIKFFFILLLFTFYNVTAQNNIDSIRQVQMDWRLKQNREIFKAISLQECEKPVFKYLYDAYCQDMQLHELVYLQILDLCVNNQDYLSVSEKKQLMAQLVQTQDQLFAIQIRYQKKINKMVSPACGYQFVMADRRINNSFGQLLMQTKAFNVVAIK